MVAAGAGLRPDVDPCNKAEESMNNSSLATTYPYLLPSLIPQSINI
jgi:hypothetical protein